MRIRTDAGGDRQLYKDGAARRSAAYAWRRQSHLDVPALPSGLEAVAPLTAISVRHDALAVR